MHAALAGFADAMDRCWLEQRFGDLAAYLAEDVVMVAPDGRQRMSGLDDAIESYRAFMRRSEVRAFRAFDHIVTERDRHRTRPGGRDRIWLAHRLGR